MTSRLIEPRAISQIPSNCGPFHLKVNIELIFLKDTVHQQLFVLAVRIDMITFQLKTYDARLFAVAAPSLIRTLYRTIERTALRTSFKRSQAEVSCLVFQYTVTLFYFKFAFKFVGFLRLIPDWNEINFGIASLRSDLQLAESLNYYSRQLNSFYSLQ